MLGTSYRNIQFEIYMLNRIQRLFPIKPNVLDIGAGAGKYAYLLRNRAARIDAVEVFEEAISVNKLHEIYNNVYCVDVRDFECSTYTYDLIIMGDILEHLTIEDSTRVLTYLIPRCKELFIIVPYLYEQDAINDNPAEVHLQPDLTHELFMQRYAALGLECLFHTTTQGIYVKRGNNYVKS
jgi:SAM-dependent methyltransferase